MSTVDNTRYARVSHSRHWSNYNFTKSPSASDLLRPEAD